MTKQNIYVDLDGTLTYTDTLKEAILQVLCKNFLLLFLMPFWLIKGLPYFKLQIANRSRTIPETLPYNKEVIDWLLIQKEQGHKLILCTASRPETANAVASFLGFFDEVLSSNITQNIAADKKKKAIENHCNNLPCIYVGNSKDDLKVWSTQIHAVVVNASKQVAEKAKNNFKVIKDFPKRDEEKSIKKYAKMLRVHQWMKNILVFVPLLTSHLMLSANSSTALLNSILAFISFSFCASSVYITNDLLDIENDRLHIRKRLRPFANATISIVTGMLLLPVLLIASFCLGWIVGGGFLFWLLVYFAITTAYSFKLKKLVLIDGLTLAALYTIRILSGTAASHVAFSFWLLAFSVFLFLSLAFVKRYAELHLKELQGQTVLHGRGYHTDDADTIKQFGISSGYASAVVLALYINSDTVQKLYATPQLLWLTIPLMLFWISRIWLKATRGKMHDDPVVFALKDKPSLLTAALMLLIFVLASYPLITVATFA